MLDKKKFWINEKDKIREVMKSATIDHELANMQKKDDNIPVYAWLTPYQIAELYCRKYDDRRKEYGLEVGGPGSGDPTNSIAWYISNNLILYYGPGMGYEFCQLSKEANSLIFGKDTCVTDKAKNTNIFRYQEKKFEKIK